MARWYSCSYTLIYRYYKFTNLNEQIKVNEFYQISNNKEEKEDFNVLRGKFDYDSTLLYDALIGGTDEYIYICNMKTGVFRYSPSQDSPS